MNHFVPDSSQPTETDRKQQDEPTDSTEGRFCSLFDSRILPADTAADLWESGTEGDEGQQVSSQLSESSLSPSSQPLFTEQNHPG